jgi:hypothetical protein
MKCDHCGVKCFVCLMYNCKSNLSCMISTSNWHHSQKMVDVSTYCFTNLKIPMMNTKLKSLFVFKSSDKIIVNQVTVFITVENEYPLFTVAIAMSSFGVLVIVAIILTLKCHVNNKNYIYLLRVKRARRQGYIPISNHDDFQYHAFVFYSWNNLCPIQMLYS